MEVISGRFSEDFGAKMMLNVTSTDNEFLEEKPQNQDEEVNDNHDDYDDDDDDDFSFVCTNPDGSPISADDIFQNGQIRPMFPLFNRDLLLADCDGASKPKSPLKKLFIEEHDDSTSAPDTTGPYCEWSGKTVQDASPESCKKSNSTGFSKLFRIRELVLRSNSDGKDAFVFFNHCNEKSEKKSDTTKVNDIKVKKVKAKEETTPLSAYMKNRSKENDKRKPYLPYKQVGFFTNVNGLSRNVHPF